MTLSSSHIFFLSHLQSVIFQFSQSLGEWHFVTDKEAHVSKQPGVGQLPAKCAK